MKDQEKYIRHSLRMESPIPGSKLAQLSSGSLNPLPSKISTLYSELSELSSEKIALAEQLIHVLTRTNARLDVDSARVRLLQGDTDDGKSLANMKRQLLPVSLSASYSNIGDGYRQPTRQLTEKLRNALDIPSGEVTLEPPYKSKTYA